MDSILALAILSLGAFLGVLTSTIFYIGVVRPRLLEMETPLPANANTETLKVLHTYLDKINQQADQYDQHSLDLQTQLEQLGQQVAAQETLLQAINRQPHAPETASPELVAQVQSSLSALETHVSQLGRQFSTQQEETKLITQQMTPPSEILKPQTDRFSDQIDHLNTMTEELRLKLDNLSVQLDAQEQITRKVLQEQAAEIARQVGEISHDVEAIKQHKPKLPQRLTDIKGIGPVYAGHLYENGVQTFEDLAVLNEEELKNLVDVPAWRRIDAAGWIKQAKLFASQREKLESDS